MEKKDKVLERFIKKFADKTLSFGCLINEGRGMLVDKKGKTVRFYDFVGYKERSGRVRKHRVIYLNTDYEKESFKKRIWGHPINWGRLCQCVHTIPTSTEDTSKGQMVQNIEDKKAVMALLEIQLISRRLMDGTMIEWVEDPTLLKSLTMLKEIYERAEATKGKSIQQH